MSCPPSQSPSPRPASLQLKATLSETGAVFLLARGGLAPQPHLFPWKNGSLVKKGPWRVPSSDSLNDQWGWPSSCPALPGAVLVPACTGSAIQLWRRCYLRGSPERQVRARLGSGQLGGGGALPLPPPVTSVKSLCPSCVDSNH